MSVVRYKTNPFLSDLVVNFREKQVRLGALGKDSHVLMNESTGEVQGTHLVTYRRVDAEQFLKLFTKNIALTFDLTSPGIKAFNVLCWAVQVGALAKDEVALDSFTLDEFLAAHEGRKPPLKNFSLATFKRGLAELETRLHEAGQGEQKPTVQLEADKESKYDTVAEVMSRASEAGLSDIAFVSKN